MMAVFVEVLGTFRLTILREHDGDHVYADLACTGNEDSLQRHGATVPPDNLLHLFEKHRDRNPKPVRRDRPADARGVDGLRALQAVTVRPPESKPAASEGPDGEVRGSRGSLIQMCAWTPLKGHYTKLRTTRHRMLLRTVGAWCKSPNKRILSYKDALQRTQCESIEATVRTRRLLWAGALLRMGDHRLPKRVMSGELENVGKRAPGGKEKEWTDCVAEYLRLFGITRDWSTAALDPGVWYSTVGEGGCRFMAAWVKEEEKASEHRLRKREAEKADNVEVAPGVTEASLRRFRTALIGPTQGLPNRR